MKKEKLKWEGLNKESYKEWTKREDLNKREPNKEGLNKSGLNSEKPNKIKVNKGGRNSEGHKIKLLQKKR